MLHRLFDSILRLFGYVPLYREKILIQEILFLEKSQDTIEQENLDLKDENSSLWHMLDEIKQSDIAQNRSALTSFVEEMGETLTNEMMKDFKPIGEA